MKILYISMAITIHRESLTSWLDWLLIITVISFSFFAAVLSSYSLSIISFSSSLVFFFYKFLFTLLSLTLSLSLSLSFLQMFDHLFICLFIYLFIHSFIHLRWFSGFACRTRRFGIGCLETNIWGPSSTHMLLGRQSHNESSIS